MYVRGKKERLELRVRRYTHHASRAPFPKKKRVPLGVEYLLRKQGETAEEDADVGVGVLSAILEKTRPQSGWPRWAGEERGCLRAYSRRSPAP